MKAIVATCSTVTGTGIVNAIRDDLDAVSRHGFEVAIENWTHDFNIGSMVRTANAFTANRVHIVSRTNGTARAR